MGERKDKYEVRREDTGEVDPLWLHSFGKGKQTCFTEREVRMICTSWSDVLKTKVSYRRVGTQEWSDGAEEEEVDP